MPLSPQKHPRPHENDLLGLWRFTIYHMEEPLMASSSIQAEMKAFLSQAFPQCLLLCPTLLPYHYSYYYVAGPMCEQQCVSIRVRWAITKSSQHQQHSAQ